VRPQVEPQGEALLFRPLPEMSPTSVLDNIPKMGMIVPEMGKKRPKKTQSGLAAALFTPVQQRVLGLLFGQPERRFGSGEIIALAGSGTGATHRQLQRLAEAGLVTVTRIGNQKHYQADPKSPIYAELHGLAVKTVGLVEPLRAALAPLASKIESAFVFGSVAKATDRATSDIDLMVVSDELGYADVYEALQSAEKTLARPINPTVWTHREWLRESAKKDSFAARIASQERIFVIGSEHAAA
jgi:predicted nucleotidyltransferase